MTLIALAFDVVLACLLAAMIFYAVKLNARIVSLREREGELQEMITQFNHSSAAAHASAGALKSAGTEAEFGIKAAIAKATAIRNDLEMMVENGGIIIQRLDAHATLDASRERSNRSEPVREAPRQPSRQPMAPPAETRLAERPPANMPPTNIKSFSPPVRNGNEVINRGDTAGQDNLQPRTEAERDLLEAIRAAKSGVA